MPREIFIFDRHPEAQRRVQQARSELATRKGDGAWPSLHIAVTEKGGNIVTPAGMDRAWIGSMTK